VAAVSIIVTTYNIEQYVEQCLESVAAQTLSDIEVLVVDDGSSDSTPAKIEAFCAKDSRFVPVLLGENSPGGVATAANAGLDRATAPWIGFVDGDDFVEPTMFQRLVEAATANDTDLAMCQYKEVDEATGERKNPADAHRWADLDRDVYRLDVANRKAFLRFISVPWRKLYRRALLEDNKVRFPVGDYFYEDNPVHWFTILSADSIALVPATLCYHRMGRSGQTMATADSRLFEIFRHHDTIHTWLTERRILDAYETSLLGWVISQMEWIGRRTPPKLQRELFDILVPIFAHYTTDVVEQALREGHKGVAAHRLSMAVAKGEYGTFARALSSRPDSTNPVVTAAYHLRHTGPRHTAVLTARYLRNRLERFRSGRVVRGLAGVAKSGRRSSRLDVMFGLTVLQSQLDDLRRQVAGVQEHLDRIESRLDLSGSAEAASADAASADAVARLTEPAPTDPARQEQGRAE
jgi:glycosyltransferase involved in cell wall biosynthesis